MVRMDMQNHQYNSPYNHIHHKKHTSKKKFVVFACIVLGLGVFLFLNPFNSSPVSQGISTRSIQDQKDIDSLMREISKIVVVPEETPLVFEIADVDVLLKENLFFLNASNGDILVVFPKSVKALVYDPREKRIVNMGPVTFGEDESQE